MLSSVRQPRLSQFPQPNWQYSYNIQAISIAMGSLLLCISLIIGRINRRSLERNEREKALLEVNVKSAMFYGNSSQKQKMFILQIGFCNTRSFSVVTDASSQYSARNLFLVKSEFFVLFDGTIMFNMRELARMHLYICRIAKKWF